MPTREQIADFQERAKTEQGRWQLCHLLNGEIRQMISLGYSYQDDRRRKQILQAWQDTREWVKEIKKALGIEVQSTQSKMTNDQTTNQAPS